MKKLLALLAALALVGSAAFAQTQPDGLTISGSLRAGIEIGTPDSDADDTDPTVRAWDTDAGAPYRVRLEFKYLGENWGAWARLQAKNAKSDPITVANYLLWGDLFNNIIRVSVGNDDLFHPFRTDGFYGQWGGFDSHFNPYYNEPSNRGLITLEVKPIAGLDIGFNFADRAILDVTDFGLVYLKDALRTSTIGAAYTNDSLSIKLQLAFHSDQEAALAGADASYAQQAALANGDEDWSSLVYGVKFTAGALSLAVDGAIDQLGTSKVTVGSEDLSLVTTEVDIKGGFAVTDALSLEAVVGLRFFDALDDSNKKTSAVPVVIMPSVKYVITPAITAGLGAAFNLDPDPTKILGGAGANWAGSKGNKAAYARLTDAGNEDYKGFSAMITPLVNFTVAKGANVVLYDEIYLGGSRVENIFGVNCRWSF